MEATTYLSDVIAVGIDPAFSGTTGICLYHPVENGDLWGWWDLDPPEELTWAKWKMRILHELMHLKEKAGVEDSDNIHLFVEGQYLGEYETEPGEKKHNFRDVEKIIRVSEMWLTIGSLMGFEAHDPVLPSQWQSILKLQKSRRRKPQSKEIVAAARWMAGAIVGDGSAMISDHCGVAICEVEWGLKRIGGNPLAGMRVGRRR